MEYARTINGRSDFIGGIDNEALDFGHLEQFIHVAVSTGANASSPSENNVDNVLATSISNSNEAICTNNHDNVASTNPNLPESPPDSGSELPFSPVDLQGLALTSRASSNNCPTVSNIESSALIDRDSILGNQHVKQQSQDLHGRLTQQQHNPSPQNQHHLYVGNNEQHTSMLATAIPLPHLHQQQMQHNDSTTVAETSASPTAINVIFGSHTRHDHHSRGHTDNLLAIDNNHQHQQQSVPHPTNGNIQSTAMNEIIEMESQTTTPYNRLIMLTAQHHQHAPSIMPSDVYMGTPAPIIESTAASILPPVRKRKLSQVDCCASMMTIKPEPGARLSPMCQQQQNINPTSPVTINLQQINVGGNHNVGSGSPLSSSLSPTGTSLSMSNDNNSLDGGSSGTPNAASFVGSNATDSSSESAPIQCIRFSPFQQHNWHTLCDQSLQELTMAHYRVDADKGFNFSVSDEAFVCQKKNHFQITCHARLQGDAKFVRTPSGLEKIKSFNLHFYGVKLEAPNQTIRVEQSQSDRSKKPFYPVPIDLQSHLVSKVTVGRLHFSETTNNNMRKKGRPNPEQRYFQLIVGLHVHTHSGHFPVVSQGSERIIVRASNPGQFESDLELCWQRGITPESIFHAGRVGINTDRPDESLVIHGNLKVSGHIIQPSDSRAKQEISELDTAVQLRNLKKIRIVRYRYEPEFALHSGLRADKDNEDEIIDTGVIAQEVREVLPDAVTEAGSIVLPSGQVIENFLLVNKDRILMENIGAVKELCKVTGSLETRIEQLEKINNRLMRMQEIERSKKKCKHLLAGDGGFMDREDELCSNRTIQMMIIILVIIMATCLAAVSTLYFVEHSKQRYIKRYDRYDISHHPFTHDPQAILVNSNLNNNNNQRNLNYNGYHTNKNGKLIIHPHTQRPPVAAAIATLPLPIHSYQMSSSIPLLDSVQQSPISLIPSVPYPSETVGIAGNSDEYGNTSNNDELLSGGIDKLALPVVLTSHLNNKTANSKNKLKWPTPSSSDAVSITTTPNESPLIDDNLNVSETSSEKIADSIPVNPDFENNSIDGTDQKPDLPRGTKHQKLVESSINQAHVANTVGEDGIRPSIGNTNQSDGRGGSSENSVLERVAGTATGVSSRKINTAREASSLSSSLTLPAATSTYFVVYKNIQSKSINDTIVSKQIVNYTVEAPSITNKSHGIDSEDSDLQNLGHNSDFTDDQNFSESITVPAVENKIDLGPIGIPDHCIRIKLEDISNCQSACFEDSNSLTTSSQNTESDIRRQQIQKQNRSSTTSGTSSLTAVSNNNTLSSHVGEFKSNSSFSKSQSVITPVMVGISTELSKYPTSKAAKCITSTNDDPEPDDQDQNERENHEEFVVAIKDKRPTHKDPKRKIESSEIQSVAMNDQQRLSSSDCSTVTPWLQGDTFNVSFGCEKICLDSGSSLNITYTIPLSKFLKDTNVELHFVSPLSLHWTVCSNKEKTKRDGVIFINPLNNGKVFQKNQNVSIFYLIIPAHGHFERLLELRSSTDSNKNLCVEQTDELNILLQYNIRIVRDCD